MALDFLSLSAQLEEAAAELQLRRNQLAGRLELALSLYSAPIRELREKLTEAKSTWLLADPVEGWQSHRPPPGGEDYSVVAVDSSHIPPERHFPAACFLINLGLAFLQYGEQPEARLESNPRLFFKPEDLVIRDPSGLREQAVEGTVMGLKRTAAEASFLADSLMAADPRPTAALWDGSLILWPLAGQSIPGFVREEILLRGFIPALDRIMEMEVPLAGYISFPHTTEVINTLRLMLCPYPGCDCDLYCRGGKRPCAEMDGLEDRDLFLQLLGPGERSPLFASRSSVVLNYYGPHHILFFYLRTPDEVARIEIPRWVYEGGKLPLLHYLIYDQCLRGGGYPVVLMEAHQQAVLSGAERRYFREMVRQVWEGKGLSFIPSPKQRSKQLPWV